MRERQPELMILDINLPDGLGWSVLDSMRVDRRDTKMAVIVCRIRQNDAFATP